MITIMCLCGFIIGLGITVALTFTPEREDKLIFIIALSSLGLLGTKLLYDALCILN